MNIRNYTIIILILIMSTTIISCNSLRSNEDNEKQELQSVEDNKQLLNEISNIRNEVQTLKKSIDSNTNTKIFNSSGGLLDVQGLKTRSALKSNISIAYPGSSAGVQNPQPYKYSWMGSPDNLTSSGNNRDCTQDLTNLTDSTIFDGHVWKINILL